MDHLEHDHDVTAVTVEPVRTGLESVDGVLASLEGLDERPVSEHVGVFETAHAQLRGALDART
jgi:hypothetical protein